MHCCTIFSDSEEEKLAIVVRLNLYRSLRSMIVTNSVITLEVMFASEFCDAALSLIDIKSYDLMASFIRTPTKDGHVDATILGTIINIPNNHNVVLCKLVSVNDKTAVYKVRFPSELGQYQLLLFSRPKVCDENVSSSSSSDSNTRTSPTITGQKDLFQCETHDDIVPKMDKRIDGICILPLLTDVFEVVSTLVGMNMTTPLLSCYRVCAGLVIKEEYGHTIGSHIYDSSIVMLRYLNKTLQHSQLSSTSSLLNYTSILTCSPNDVVMELGSGCGLVSIWLSQHISLRIVATDLTAQLPFLHSNFHRNALPSLPLHDTGCIKEVDDETRHTVSSQTQIPLASQSRLPLVTRLDWTEFRTKMNNQQDDSSPTQNKITTTTTTTDSCTQKMGTTFNDQEQRQTRSTNVHQQNVPQVCQDGSDRQCCEREHTTGGSETSSSPPWTFRQRYQFEHMGLAATDECAMIIACDVLYDRTIVDDFFAVVRSFSKRSPSRTVLLLAQKLRNYDDHVFKSTTASSTALPPTVDVTLIKGFECHKVYEEAQVVIWKMWIDPVL